MPPLNQLTTISVAFLFTGLLLSDLGAQVTYSFENDVATAFLTRDTVTPTPVDNDINGDQSLVGNNEGVLIQIGWFDGQVFGDEETMFDGEFQVLVSFFSGDSSTTTEDTSDGTMILSWSFNDTGYVKYYNDPAATESGLYEGTKPPNSDRYLAIRWYDTNDSSGFYNTVTSASWLWKSTAFPGIGTEIFMFDTTGLSLESGENPSEGLFASIPEPGIGGMVFSAMALMGTLVRRRKEKIS